MQGRHANRASFACIRCKKARRRCDISQLIREGFENPKCTACRNQGKHCEVRYGEDKRSNRPANDLQALQQRIRALEDRLEENSHRDRELSGNGVQRSPETSISHNSSGQHRDPGLSASLYTYQDGESSPIRKDSSMISDTGLLEYSTSIAPPISEAQGQYLSSPTAFPYSEKRTSDIGNGLGNDQTPVYKHQRDCSCRHVVIDTHAEPEPVVTHLLELFWEWQSCHIIAIDRETFTRHRKNWDDRGSKGDRNFYTPCLFYSMLAMASLISPDAGVKRYSACDANVPGERFSGLARSLFDREMENPTITTVQAALLLGSRYGSMVDNSLGWTYTGKDFKACHYWLVELISL